MLCSSPRTTELPPTPDAKVYFRCDDCDLHFLHPDHRLGADDERRRYDLHHADVNDPGYAEFVRPLLDAVTARVRPGARGLDFGAGRVPVLAHHLRARGYDVTAYDAFYWPAARALETRYDFVVACEVVEHLFRPGVEFARLRDLIKPGGPLLVMTEARRDEIDFGDWHYRRDPTHVGFYSARTFRWIGEAFGFKNTEIASRVVCFITPEVE